MNCKQIVWWLEVAIPLLVSVPFLFNWIVLKEGKPVSQCLGITIITACWWIFEPLPIVVTALIPIFGLPFVGVSTASAVSAAMFTDTSIVFLGGFLFSIAMVKWNLHSRIALKTVIIFGLKPRLLLFGIILVTAFLSMWISNTATALTMVPNAMAIVSKIEELTGDPEGVAPFSKALFLGIAFSASIGGMATLIGTPPNLIFAQNAKSIFNQTLGFAEFMFVAFPTAVVLLIIMYLFFIFVYMRKLKLPPNMDETVFHDSYDRLGPMSPAETTIGVLFILLALLWVFRTDLKFGDSFTIPGWSGLLFGKNGTKIADGTVALALSFILFLIYVPPLSDKIARQNQSADIELDFKKEPQNRKYKAPLELDSSEGMEEEINDVEIEGSVQKENPQEWVPILDWETVQQKVPWNILFLFSGGFALNKGFTDSTLDNWIGSHLAGLTKLPLFVLLLGIAFVTSGLSNIASNTACANIMLPIVASVAKSAKEHHPWLLMFPCAFATSCCFILPIATPPNLICFGSGRLTAKDFMVAGSLINVVGLFVVVIMTMILVPPVFDANSFPTWANTSLTTIN